MDTALKTLLETRAASVNDIADTLGRSPTWVRTQLKKHDDLVCEAPSALNPRMTIYYLPAPQEPVEATGPGCRFCASANISAAGEIGTFLGAATVCGDCGKTYNTFSGEEITPSATTGVKKKRQPLNPQYKIRAKVEAVQAAGGNLSFDKEARQWIMTAPGWNGRRETFTALEFSTETPQSLGAKIQVVVTLEAQG